MVGAINIIKMEDVIGLLGLRVRWSGKSLLSRFDL